MHSFEYTRAHDLDAALRLAQEHAHQIRFLAGGTTLIDLMKLDVETPSHVVDINGLGLDRVEQLSDGRTLIGALVRNADLANDAHIADRYPVLSQALLSGASPQLRNMATTGGNLLQRTRCVYFRDRAARCNKREPGTGCDAIEGHHRNLAVLGTSEHCIASNPSDMNVALMALDATVHVQHRAGERAIPIREFYLLPGDTPHRETVLEPGEMITYVGLTPLGEGTHTCYIKLRDRASYEFALASAAVVLQVHDGRIAKAGIALGGVGTRPWHCPQAEQVLLDQIPTRSLYEQAAKAALQDAIPYRENGFKIELARRCLVHTLSTALPPQ
ncbi:xanthine dehydrogenase family protein subunit M [Bordetella sp. 15P40C-2]|uniref:FAD binding domain-containing protein n=1 Tax=Bordetella sp. 15P40C-2 TaxID=2572246 RepID=UPI00132C9156|nr:xanthine dehydrogenase family protein subunit M [Bordetella sp. 15P40C-2]MVW72381.1 xanthine dehydrogenase family protein subunit M [Bordetella sp. 15P40C-2]